LASLTSQEVEESMIYLNSSKSDFFSGYQFFRQYKRGKPFVFKYLITSFPWKVNCINFATQSCTYTDSTGRLSMLSMKFSRKCKRCVCFISAHFKIWKISLLWQKCWSRAHKLETHARQTLL
jgi:hypothetical protein